MEEKGIYGLVIASMVAVVALVGLVMLFSQTNATGASFYNMDCLGGRIAPVELVGSDGKISTHMVCVTGRTVGDQWQSSKGDSYPRLLES